LIFDKKKYVDIKILDNLYARCQGQNEECWRKIRFSKRLLATNTNTETQFWSKCFMISKSVPWLDWLMQMTVTEIVVLVLSMLLSASFWYIWIQNDFFIKPSTTPWKLENIKVWKQMKNRKIMERLTKHWYLNFVFNNSMALH